MKKIQNNTLAQYLALNQEIAKLQKAQKDIKAKIMAAGDSFETNQFMVSIKEYEFNHVCGANELLEKIGFVKVEELGLIKTSTAKRLDVKRKEKLIA
jgi:hypothetical protein